MTPFKPKPEPEPEEEGSSARVNFRMPIETYKIMREFGALLGYRSAGGAARHFFMIGLQMSAPQLASLKSVELNEKQLSANLQNVAANQGAVRFMQAMANCSPELAQELASSSILDTMGITRDGEEKEPKKKGGKS